MRLWSSPRVPVWPCKPVVSAGLFQKGMSSQSVYELRQEWAGRSGVREQGQQTQRRAQTQPRFHRRKPPRANVAPVLRDPVVRGKAFQNSVEKAHTQQAPG